MRLKTAIICVLLALILSLAACAPGTTPPEAAPAEAAPEPGTWRIIPTSLEVETTTDGGQSVTIDVAFENGTDYLSNYILISLDLVAVDAVTSYLMGHNPGELHYLRIANERGYGAINMDSIPIYIIDAKNTARLVDYRTLKRYRLGVDLHRTPKEPLKFY